MRPDVGDIAPLTAYNKDKNEVQRIELKTKEELDWVKSYFSF